MKKEPASFKLLIGIGNPGMRYKNTYHNVGILAVEFLASQENPSITWDHPKSKPFSFFKHNGVIYARSSSFMNQSGEAVQSAIKFFRTPLSRVVVVHDESDLPIGTFRVSKGRGSAGHHGIESIEKTLETNDFSRIRIGIRNNNEAKAKDMVLKTIKKSDDALLYSVFEEVMAKLSENT